MPIVDTWPGTWQALLVHNAKVYLAARDPEKARAAIEDLRTHTGKDPVFLKLDLADLASVKAAAEEFIAYVGLLLHFDERGSCPFSIGKRMSCIFFSIMGVCRP